MHDGARGGHASLSQEALRAVVPAPHGLVIDKERDHLDRSTRDFIRLSPLLIVASAGADGRCDASPRGDPPGFVKALDDRTLLVPDRKGNRRVDTMQNIIETGHVGLLFLVPGRSETLRVNGSAIVVDDRAHLERCAIEGRSPELGILVQVQEVFFHCARAFLRGGVWDVEGWPNLEALPTLGQMLSEQTGSFDARELDVELEEANRDLY